MSVRRLFTEHPRSVGETYWQHFFVALRFGSRMIVGGLACIVHALLPFLFRTTGSRTITKINDEMMRRRGARHDVALGRAECSTSAYESDARARDGLEWHPR